MAWSYLDIRRLQGIKCWSYSMDFGGWMVDIMKRQTCAFKALCIAEHWGGVLEFIPRVNILYFQMCLWPLSSPHFNRLLRRQIILNHVNQSESGRIGEIFCCSQWGTSKPALWAGGRKPLFVVLVDFWGANITTTTKFKFPDINSWHRPRGSSSTPVGMWCDTVQERGCNDLSLEFWACFLWSVTLGE